MNQTLEWTQYERGKRYKASINLYKTVDKNERFYAKRHWEGVKTNGCPAVILPISKRIIDFKVAMIMSDLVSITFSPQGVSDDATDPGSMLQKEIAAQLTDYARTVAENTKFDSMNADGLLDAALTGDMISYWYWDETIDVGNGVMGDINGHLVDNVNFFPGDVNNPEINDVYGPVQPYIILAFRKNVKEVREEAKTNGVSEDDIALITPDNDIGYQAGEMSKTELNDDEESGKCTVLLKMWREFRDGRWHIMARKSTEKVVIRNTWDTELTRYPVALMSWDIRKGCCHGEPEMTSLINNQVVINRLASMITWWIHLHGFPKVIYDKTRIDTWTNNFFEALPVRGEIGGAAQYMQPGQLSAAVYNFFNAIIGLTKEASGANESILGEADPTNTSAIIVNSRNAAVPLNNIKRRFYRYVEDVALIWLDFWMNKYTQYPMRPIEVTRNGVKQVVMLNTEALKSMRLKLRIDVSPSSPFDEAAQQTTLDNLLAQGHISFVEWLERVRKGVIPDKEGLLEARIGAEAQQRAEEKQFLYELMGRELERILPTLPKDVQKNLNMLQRNDPAGYEATVKQIIAQAGQQQLPARPYAENVEVMI